MEVLALSTTPVQPEAEAAALEPLPTSARQVLAALAALPVLALGSSPTWVVLRVQRVQRVPAVQALDSSLKSVLQQAQRRPGAATVPSSMRVPTRRQAALALALPLRVAVVVDAHHQAASRRWVHVEATVAAQVVRHQQHVQRLAQALPRAPCRQQPAHPDASSRASPSAAQPK